MSHNKINESALIKPFKYEGGYDHKYRYGYRYAVGYYFTYNMDIGQSHNEIDLIEEQETVHHVNKVLNYANALTTNATQDELNQFFSLWALLLTKFELYFDYLTSVQNEICSRHSYAEEKRHQRYLSSIYLLERKYNQLVGALEDTWSSLLRKGIPSEYINKAYNQYLLPHIEVTVDNDHVNLGRNWIKKVAVTQSTKSAEIKTTSEFFSANKTKGEVATRSTESFVFDLIKRLWKWAFADSAEIKTSKQSDLSDDSSATVIKKMESMIDTIEYRWHRGKEDRDEGITVEHAIKQMRRMYQHFSYLVVGKDGFKALDAKYHHLLERLHFDIELKKQIDYYKNESSLCDSSNEDSETLLLSQKNETILRLLDKINDEKIIWGNDYRILSENTVTISQKNQQELGGNDLTTLTNRRRSDKKTAIKLIKELGINSNTLFNNKCTNKLESDGQSKTEELVLKAEALFTKSC